jgi:hypothetical protein
VAKERAAILVIRMARTPPLAVACQIFEQVDHLNSRLLRIYAPLEPCFGKTWKPGDFELLELVECGEPHDAYVSLIEHPSAETLPRLSIAYGHALKTVLVSELKGLAAHAACVAR